MEEIELKPSHSQQGTIVVVDGIREEVGKADGEQLERVAKRAQSHCIKGKLEKVGINEQRAEERADVGEADARKMIGGIDGRKHLAITGNLVNDIDKRSPDDGERASVGEPEFHVHA